MSTRGGEMIPQSEFRPLGHDLYADANLRTHCRKCDTDWGSATPTEPCPARSEEEPPALQRAP